MRFKISAQAVQKGGLVAGVREAGDSGDADDASAADADGERAAARGVVTARQPPVAFLILAIDLQLVIRALGAFFKQVDQIPLAPQPLLVIRARAVRVIAEDDHVIDLDLHGKRRAHLFARVHQRMAKLPRVAVGKVCKLIGLLVRNTIAQRLLHWPFHCLSPAKGQMVNAALVAMELHGLLPALETPYYTENYEGFYHLVAMRGETEQAELQYIIRDHDRAKFEARKAVMEKACAEIDRRYGAGTAALTLRDSYYNMKEKIAPCMFLIENAKKAMESVGVTPKIVPIRGGTDGARLSFEGLPCPNLCTGGENFHGRFEYIPADDMETITNLLAQLMWQLAE